MLHVRLDEVTGGESGAEGQFASQDGSGNDTCEEAGVLAGRRGMRTTHAEEVEHGTLGIKDGAATQCANFDRGHRDRDL